MSDALKKLQAKLINCRRCPRLVRYLRTIRSGHPDFWCRPVPLFGDPRARIVLLGLAPGRLGSNRSGRMFTGDASGTFLYRALYNLGLSSSPHAHGRRDGLKLYGVAITAVLRCAPPGNKPAPDELKRCAPYFAQELDVLKTVRVVVALGKIAHDGFIRLKCSQESGRASAYPFQHSAVHRFHDRPAVLVDAYHPSRQNTNTGVLTMGMFKSVLRTAMREAGL